MLPAELLPFSALLGSHFFPQNVKGELFYPTVGFSLSRVATVRISDQVKGIYLFFDVICVLFGRWVIFRWVWKSSTGFNA